jgi:hypothetical protein
MPPRENVASSVAAQIVTVERLLWSKQCLPAVSGSHGNSECDTQNAEFRTSTITCPYQKLHREGEELGLRAIKVSNTRPGPRKRRHAIPVLPWRDGRAPADTGACGWVAAPSGS